MTLTKPIIDPCCGGRMFYFDKKSPHVLYCDNRQINQIANDGRQFEVAPDVVCDFTKLPFSDKSFKHVVFDPPHTPYLGKNGQMALHYTTLPRDWQPLIRDGFAECWRVLDDYGTLIFKWSAKDISVKRVLEAIEHEPLYGHKSGKASNTHWMAFVKIPQEDYYDPNKT